MGQGKANELKHSPVMQGTNVSNPCTTLQMSAVIFNVYLFMQSRRDPSGKKNREPYCNG